MVVRIVNTVSLFALVALVALRPLITETYDSSESSITRALGGVGDPTPLRTLAFDVLILGCTTAVFATRAARRASSYRRTGLEWGLALLALAGIASCLTAGQMRLAVNATIDWLCLPILAITLTQLLRTGWQRRLLLAAVVGAACVQAVQCYEQRFITFDEVQQDYADRKDGFWARQGVELDSTKVVMFEARMRAREASGFMPHSNVAGSYLILAGFAAVGIAVRRLRQMRRETDWANVGLSVGCAGAALLILAAVPLTGSRGAMVSAVVAGVLWALIAAMRRWVDRHRRRLFVAAWVAILVGVVAVVGHGLYHGSLPGVSLSFRWQYWRASAEMIADHPLTGVGRENFGRHYPGYKSIESSEEISTPHNLFVQAAAEWGLPGLVGLLLMLFGASRRLALGPGNRRDVEAAGLPPPHNGDDPDGARMDTSPAARWAWFAALTLFVLGLRVLLLGSNDFNYVYYVTAVAAIAWTFGSGVVWFGRTDVEDDGDRRNGSCVVAHGVIFGLFAFVLHDMINFALFTPATATTFFALIAIPLSREVTRQTDDNPAKPRESVRWLPAIGFGLILVAVLVAATVPVARARGHLQRARVLARTWQTGTPIDEQPAYAAFTAAANADPLDPTPFIERAQWLEGLSVAEPSLRKDALAAATESIELAIPRDPHNSGVYRLRMRVYLELASTTGRRSDYATAIVAARQALARYPQDPYGLESLADTEAEAGRARDSDDLLRQALTDYRRALELDDQRLEWETLRRFQPTERARIERKIDALRSVLEQ